MKTNLEKKQFIEKSKKSIKNKKELISIYENIILPALKKFDGKVYNKRFFTYLKEQTKDIELLSIEPDKYNFNQFVIGFYVDRRNYDLESCLYVGVGLDVDRINYEETINNKTFQAWISNIKESVSQIEDAIKNYDKCMSVAERLQKYISEYGKMNFYFRENVYLSGLLYLK